MTPAQRLMVAGFIATALAFGPARMGFGLFLPAFREDFALSTSLAGAIASGGFLAFLLALLASAWISRRYGERVSVIAGALAASAGFAAVAAAGAPGALAAGIALAGSSAGLCWAPFNDAADRVVRGGGRAGVLSVVSTGTTVGILVAAGLALAVTQGALDWRWAWLGFAAAGGVLAAIARACLPKGRAPAPDPERAGQRSFFHRDTVPLYGAALVFGATNAVFLSFAADRVVGAGGLPGLPDRAAAAVIFLGYGVFGLVGLATRRIEAGIGLAALCCAIFAAGALSLALIALAPGSWTAVIAASGLHGAAIMTISAVFSFWSLRMFPGRGTAGFTATLLGVAAGSVLGPALAGLLATSEGPETMFLTAAVPPLAAALWFGARVRRPSPNLPPFGRDV